MVTYIYQNQMKTYINFHNKEILIHDGSINSYLAKLCLKKLFDLKIYKTQVSLLLKKTKRIPIYIDKELLLIPLSNTKDYNIIYINYYMINRFEIFDKSVKILMLDGLSFVYQQGIDSFMKLMNLSENIIKIKEGKIYG